MELKELSKKSNWSEIEYCAIKLLEMSVVSEQTAMYVDGEGQQYTVKCTVKCTQDGQIMTSQFFKNGKHFAVMIYNIETLEEEWM